MKRILLSFMFLVASLNADEIYTTFVVQADKNANLAFTTTGTINNVLVEVSSVVKKDDVLATLKNDDLKAMLQISKTDLKYAKSNYNRQLKVKNMINKEKLDQYAFRYESAKAKVTYQQALLNKTILKAPFDGVIYNKTAEIGNVVSGAMLKTVFKIQSNTQRKLILNFDQKYWKEVKVGQIFSYKVDGDDKTYETKITKIHPSINGKNRKIQAEAIVNGFIVGLFGDGYIMTPTKEK